MSMASAVRKLSRPRTVRLPFAPQHDGSSPRPSSLAAPVTISIKLAIQPDTASPTTLERSSDGDETTGKIKVWVTDKALAKAEDVANPGVPLGLTELPIAPPEGEDGPPGAIIEWGKRRYELDRDRTIEESLGATKKPGFKRYRASERGGIQP